MRKLLDVMLRAFPLSFRAQMGEEWILVASDLLSAARARGPLAYVQCWAALMLDTLLSAPPARIRALWGVVTGKSEEPIVVSYGSVLALAKRGGRAAGTRVDNFIAHYWPFALLGALLTFAAFIVTFASVASDMTDEPGFDRGLTSSAWTLIAGVGIWGLYIAGSSWSRIRAWWQAKGRPVIAPLMHLAVGSLLMQLGLVSLLVSNNMALYTEPFIEFPLLQERIHLNRFKEDASGKLVTTKPEWFFDDGTLRPEKKAAWCSNALSELAMVERMHQRPQVIGRQVDVLLYQGLLGVVMSEQCISLPQWLEHHDRLAALATARPSLWSQVSLKLQYLPYVNRLGVAEPIITPRLFLTPQHFCEKSHTFMPSPAAGKEISMTQYVDVCIDKYSSGITPAKPISAGERMKRKILRFFGMEDLTRMRQQNATLRSVSAKEAQQIIDYMRSQETRYVIAKKAGQERFP